MMKLNGQQFARMLDGTLTATNTTKAQYQAHLETAIKYHFYSVIGLRCYIPMTVEALKETDVLPGSGCCLASGADATEVKVYAGKSNVALGAKELDMVMNLSYFKSGLYDLVVDDIRRVKEAVGNIPLKCIIEAPLLTDEEIRTACALVVEGGADYLKTATGQAGPTTLHHIEVISGVLKGRIKIKAAGGIRKIETVEQMTDLGVSRFGVGSASAIKLIQAFNDRS
ncbi:MAG TPA: deoxyribose-phosphate aldolase [Clostridia bacterium]|nr:deoxyribose-phosphate aldolase [Clostridia bacterium]